MNESNDASYFLISNIGKIAKLKFKFHANMDEIVKKYHWVKYNPRSNKQHIPRFGMSLTSLDGQMYPYTTPDLDSLKEYNQENNTTYNDFSFTLKTPLWYDLSLDEYFNDIKDDIKRSHLIMLPPGGYFPYHRDGLKESNLTFRIILTLKNCHKNNLCFILDNQVLNLQNNCFYYINTRLEHTVVNISGREAESIFGVFTIPINQTNINWLMKNLETI